MRVLNEFCVTYRLSYYNFHGKVEGKGWWTPADRRAAIYYVIQFPDPNVLAQITTVQVPSQKSGIIPRQTFFFLHPLLFSSSLRVANHHALLLRFPWALFTHPPRPLRCESSEIRPAGFGKQTRTGRKIIEPGVWPGFTARSAIAFGQVAAL